MDRTQSTTILKALVVGTETAEMLSPKVYSEFAKSAEPSKVRLRVRMGALLTEMVSVGWLRPVTIGGRTHYEITQLGRAELWKRTAN